MIKEFSKINKNSQQFDSNWITKGIKNEINLTVSKTLIGFRGKNLVNIIRFFSKITKFRIFGAFDEKLICVYRFFSHVCRKAHLRC